MEEKTMPSKDELMAKVAGVARKVASTAIGYGGIFSTLQKDHAEVSSLMTRLAATRASDDEQSAHRRDLFETIRSELLAHASAEETTFYARLKSEPDIFTIIGESIEDHQRVDDLLEELYRLGTDSLIFDSRFDELFATVEHHVAEEENRLFPRAKEALAPRKSRRSTTPSRGRRDRCWRAQARGSAYDGAHPPARLK
jgi:hemerythrin superfamily protein